MFVDTPQYESGYNTAATNDNTNGSRDYGIFQVSRDQSLIDLNESLRSMTTTGAIPVSAMGRTVESPAIGEADLERLN